MSLTDAQEQPLSPIPEPLSSLASKCPPLLTHCPPPATASAEPSADNPLAPYDPLKLRDLRAADPNVSWLWDGYLARGAVTLLTHHPSKRSRPHGLASRGSGALPAFVDILIEMDRFDPKNDEDRRRRLHAYSRFERTPVHAILELNAAGNDYLHLGDFHQAECADGWERVRRVLENAPCKLRRDEMLEDWPLEDLPAPAEINLRRWLDKAVAEGKVAREGAGLRNHPHLYWRPGKEVEWPDDPLWWLKEMPEPFDFEKEDKETMRQERRKRGREKAPE